MTHVLIQTVWIAAMTWNIMVMRSCIKDSSPAEPEKPSAPSKETVMQSDNKTDAMPKTEKEWRAILTNQQYYVLRKKGTERPFTGKYDTFFKEGIYKCSGCGELLFTSESKYNSGCGWPAFSAPAEEKAVKESRDLSHGMIRTEITCSKCGGHLGHVFNDGPAPTGQRYCINSAALEFEKKTSTPPEQ